MTEHKSGSSRDMTAIALPIPDAGTKLADFRFQVRHQSRNFKAYLCLVLPLSSTKLLYWTDLKSKLVQYMTARMSTQAFAMLRHLIPISLYRIPAWVHKYALYATTHSLIPPSARFSTSLMYQDKPPSGFKNNPQDEQDLPTRQ